jgi:hypothetical protein
MSWLYQEEAEAAVGIGRLLQTTYPGLKPVLISPIACKKRLWSQSAATNWGA